MKLGELLPTYMLRYCTHLWETICMWYISFGLIYTIQNQQQIALRVPFSSQAVAVVYSSFSPLSCQEKTSQFRHSKHGILFGFRKRTFVVCCGVFFWLQKTSSSAYLLFLGDKVLKPCRPHTLWICCPIYTERDRKHNYWLSVKPSAGKTVPFLATSILFVYSELLTYDNIPKSCFPHLWKSWPWNETQTCWPHLIGILEVNLFLGETCQ